MLRNLNIDIKASSRYPIKRKGIKESVEKVLNEMNVFGEIELEVEIIGDRKMSQLHEKYLKESGTTDVLSFPLYDNFLNERNKISQNNFPNTVDNIIRLGSIVISYPQAQKQAIEYNITVNEEINRLVEHAMLHLLGIHHE